MIHHDLCDLCDFDYDIDLLGAFYTAGSSGGEYCINAGFMDDHSALVNDWLKSNIGKEVIVKLLNQTNYQQQLQYYNTIKIVIGNYRELNKIYLDIPTDVCRDRSTGLSIYPNRLGIIGYPVREGYSRIMMGMHLCHQTFSFYIPDTFRQT